MAESSDPNSNPRAGLSRREVAAGAMALAVLPLMGGNAVSAPADMAVAMKKVLGAAVPRIGRVMVKIPELTENGNSTPIDIAVDSPMTESDHVKALHIFSERNPVPHLARFEIGPWAGKAHVRTNIRLADTQTITVVAEMSDGSFWSGTADSIVTAPACIDESMIR